MTQLRELQLMKRTAWMNIQLEKKPRKHNPKEDADIVTAMYMLAYLGAIDMALIDLTEDLDTMGLFRHSVKHNVRKVTEIVAKANGYADRILKAVNDGQRVRQYADMFEYAYNTVQKCILITPPHRSYSIIKALSRLFIEAYNKVGVKTNHHYLADVAKILPIIDIPQLNDHNIDCIIRKTVQINIKR